MTVGKVALQGHVDRFLLGREGPRRDLLSGEGLKFGE